MILPFFIIIKQYVMPHKENISVKAPLYSKLFPYLVGLSRWNNDVQYCWWAENKALWSL